MRQSATAFAPASVGNVAIGFDILGHTVEAIGDRVHVERTATPGVIIRAITGVAVDLPLEAEKNTAGRALLSLAQDEKLDFGFAMTIEKGIPLGSGLGGSAASAVAAGASAVGAAVAARGVASARPRAPQRAVSVFVIDGSSRRVPEAAPLISCPVQSGRRSHLRKASRHPVSAFQPCPARERSISTASSRAGPPWASQA